MNTPFSFSDLSTSLPLGPSPIVALYGAGGKTSLMDRLGRELASQGKRVILTTTTKIYKPREYPCIIGSGFKSVAESLAATLTFHSPVVLGRELTSEGKLTGIDPDWPRALLDGDLCDAVLVEADGAAHKPIKGYAVHEPVFPRSATLLIPVLGYDALGIPVDEDHIHRVEAFCTLTGARPGGRVTVHNFLAVMAYMIGIGTERCPGAALVPVINKMDLGGSTRQIRSIQEAFPARGAVDRLLFTDLKGKMPVPFLFRRVQGVFEPDLAAVVLAAGQSSRMGRQKLEMTIGGKTLLERAIGPMLDAGFKEIVVVTDSLSGWIAGRFPPSVRIAANPQSPMGIATSLQAGILSISPCIQAIVFVLGDQPFITADVYRSLIEHYRQSLKALIYPVYQGQRGNPVLFDRRLWNDLLALQGDNGGKQLFAAVPPQDQEGVPVDCPGILVDIDTPEAYARFAAHPPGRAVPGDGSLFD